MTEKKISAFSGTLWCTLERFSVQALQMIIGIVLARLLMPEDFGLIAMVSAVIMISNYLVDGGLCATLVQRQDITYVDECTVFWTNLLIGIFMIFVLWNIAPYISEFYNQNKLTLIIRILSINIIITSLNNVQTWLLTKRIDFKTLFYSRITAVLVSGALSIFLAFKGYGVWSLVVHSIIGSLVNAIFVWVLSNWTPSLVYSWVSLKKTFGFGWKLLASSILVTIFDNLHYVIIGKIFSSVSLGYYAKAKQTQEIPVNFIANIVNRISFPVLSNEINDKKKFDRSLKGFVILTAFISFPALTGLAAVSESFVTVLLTEKWIICVPYLQLFCIAGVWLPLSSVLSSVLLAHGRSDLHLRIIMITNIVRVLLLVVALNYGIIAIIITELMYIIIRFMYIKLYVSRIYKYRIDEQIKDYLPYVVLSILSGFGAYALVLTNMHIGILLLLSQVTLGILVYLGLAWLFKVEAINILVSLLRKKSIQ